MGSAFTEREWRDEATTPARRSLPLLPGRNSAAQPAVMFLNDAYAYM